jgi:hypothetical protein
MHPCPPDAASEPQAYTPRAMVTKVTASGATYLLGEGGCGQLLQ